VHDHRFVLQVSRLGRGKSVKKHSHCTCHCTGFGLSGLVVVVLRGSIVEPVNQSINP